MRAGQSSAWLALIVGVSLGGFELLVNWGQWQWWPYWLVDFVASALLIGGGIQTLRRSEPGLRLLCAGWAFAIGMAWMSFAGNFESGVDPARAGRVAGFCLALIGLMIATSLVGLVLALTARRD